MNTLVVLIIVFATTHAFSVDEEWYIFKKKYGRQFTSEEEEKYRFSIFQSNLRKIGEHNINFNRGRSSFRMGINKFTDQTSDEFLALMKLSKTIEPAAYENDQFTSFDGKVPDHVDWSRLGAVTSVKDQGQCGSCWTFSTTGAVESAYFINSGSLISLSEQNLIDCAKDECNGCSGGWMDKAMEFIEQYGIMSEDDYPYEAVDDKCRFNASASILKVKTHRFVKKGDEVDLQKAVALQPVSVAIDVTLLLQFYQSGIFNDPNCQSDISNLNHAVLVVGYGTENGVDYWIVKNSWGFDWGMFGYVWMSRNKNNQCGIATDAVYPMF